MVKNPLKTEWQRKWLGLEAIHPSIQTMADAAQQWAGATIRNSRTVANLLVLVGDTGIGKTETLKKLFWFIRSASVTARDLGYWSKPPTYNFIEWGEYVEECTNGKPYPLNDDILFIDDLGSEVDRFRSGNPTELLRRVLGARERKWTAITSNIIPSKWASVWDVRVADRLFRDSKVVALTGVESYALWKMQNK